MTQKGQETKPSQNLTPAAIDSGYREATELATAHYENFPVISFLIPKRLRKDVAVIYWFARTADDIADEGDFSPEHKLEALAEFESRFHALLEGEYLTNLEASLDYTIQTRGLSTRYFTDLLSAFRQDIVKTRYRDMQELLDYCRRSANPVGRLLLELYGVHDERATEYSDAVCTALQLANFWQDVSRDIEKGRIYVPQDYMERRGIDESMFSRSETPEELKQCICELVDYTEVLFRKGAHLLPFLPFRFRMEIAWTILGGRKILAKIEKINYNVVSNRVRLHFSDILRIFFRSLLYVATVGPRHSKRK